jgi:hypothetical protein
MSVETDVIIHWIFGIIGSWIAIGALLEIIESTEVKNQKRILTSIAMTNGIFFAADISAMATAAAEISQSTLLLSDGYVELVRRLLDIATIVTLVVGAGKMHQKSKKAGVFAFVLAFIGGVILVAFIDIFVVGLVVLVFAFGFEEASQTIKF